MKLQCRFLAGLLLCAAAGAGSAAPRYKLTVLDNAPSVAVAINNAGDIVGNLTGPATPRAFVWRGGRSELLPDKIESVSAISPLGHIAGVTLYEYGGGGYFNLAVIYYQGTLQVLGSPIPPGMPEVNWYRRQNVGGIDSAGKAVVNVDTDYTKVTYLGVNGAHPILPLSQVSALNEAGMAAGISGRDDWPPAQAALYDTDSGRVTMLGTLRTGSYAYSSANDVNDLGVAVGESYMGYGAQLHMHSFLYRDGVMAPLGNLAVDNGAAAINNRGAVVGNYQRDGVGHAYLYQDGAQYDLDTLLAGGGWRVSRAEDVNDGGFIVGQACSTTGGACVAALLAPVPEPAAWAMLLAGLVIAGWRLLAGRVPLRRLWAALLLGGGAGWAAAAPQYALTVLDTAQGIAVGINNAGQIAGNRWDVTERRSFLWQAGQITYLPRDFVSVAAIGQGGHIVGSSTETIVGGGIWMWSSGLVYHQGRVSEIPEAFEPNRSPGYWYSYTDAINVNSAGDVVAHTVVSGRPGGSYIARHDGKKTILPMWQVAAINDAGQVAGQTGDDIGARAALYVDGTLTDLGKLPSSSRGYSSATDLNELGMVVGYSSYGEGKASHLHSFLYYDGHMEPLGNLTVGNASTAINNLGDVVGNFTLPGPGGGTAHAYLYQDGVQYDLADLVTDANGWRVSRAQDINDSGQIVGQACDRHAECVPILLSPVPEPTTYGLLLAGLGVLGWRQRKTGWGGRWRGAGRLTA